MIGVPDGQGGEKWTWLCVGCFEVQPAAYIDGKTNLGSDGELVDGHWQLTRNRCSAACCQSRSSCEVSALQSVRGPPQR